MLEKPNIEDHTIADCLQAAYDLTVRAIEFLPIGADKNTAVYRAATDEGAYFVKLRSGTFDELTVAIPKYLHEQGITQVIAPITTQSGQLWADLGDFKVFVSPFINGRNGYEVALSDAHWVELGRALRGIHSVSLPATWIDRIQQEHYADVYREQVKAFQRQLAENTYPDPVSAALGELINKQRDVINRLVSRADTLATVLQSQSPPFVLCHADIHAGNVLIDNDNRLYIVDWDTLIFAPKERDLMYAGGGQFGSLRSPQEEERLFFHGYGQTQVNPVGLAYYRYERIVQDIAAFCEEILTTAVGEDRAMSLHYLTGQFNPNQVIDIAFRSETNLPPALAND